MYQFPRWKYLGCPFEIEYSPQVVDEIRRKSIDGFLALRRGGLEIGGLLFGTVPHAAAGRTGGSGAVRILSFEEIACSHSKGPSFTLSEPEIDQLRKRISVGGEFEPLGLYFSKTRGDLELSVQQQDLFAELFPAKNRFVLLLKPASLDPTRAALVFHSGDQLVRTPDWLLAPSAGETGSYQTGSGRLDPGGENSSSKEIRHKLDRLIASVAFAGADATGSAPITTPPVAVAPVALAQSASSPSALPEKITAAMFMEVETALGAPAAVIDDPSEGVPTLVVPSSGAKPADQEFKVDSEPDGRFAPEPIKVAFSSGPDTPLAPPWYVRWGEVIERNVMAPIRKNRRRVLISVATVVVGTGVGAGIYYSRPLWVTPPPPNLTVSDDHGTMTFRWDPRSAEFINAGTLTIAQSGDSKTVALTHSELMKGRLTYTRTDKHVSASLALNDRRFPVRFDER